MSGQDVYDLAVWCRWCDAPHADCEPVGDRDECVVCGDDIDPDKDYCSKHQP